MHLSQLVSEPIIGADVDIDGIAIDSRQVKANHLFCALRGELHDGHDYIDQAVAAGATAVAVETAERINLDNACSYVVIPQLRRELGEIAARFYRQPSRQLSVIGVTGTNGKTSITHYISQLQAGLGKKAAVIGTLGTGFEGCYTSSLNTTPDALSLQQSLSELREAGVGYVAMEVSSHALDQQRCNGIHFAGAVFSNLSRDHLDYHGSEQAYFAAKARLFVWPGLRWAVLNRDDACFSRLADSLLPSVKCLSYSLVDTRADLSFVNVRRRVDGYQAELLYQGKSHALQLAVHGEFNLANVLAAIAALLAEGEDVERVVAACEEIRPVAGRMQSIENDCGIVALVDYAHTPDALEKVLKTLRDEAGSSQLLVVFGCGGDRDQGKRPQMAAVAERYADFSIVTADNPRLESVAAINEEIVSGFSGRKYMVEPDRKKAVELAVKRAGKGDYLLVAGKGHEKYQQVGARKLPFDDVAVLRHALAERRAG